MKKNYEMPECKIENLITEDVITASGGGQGVIDPNPEYPFLGT